MAKRKAMRFYVVSSIVVQNSNIVAATIAAAAVVVDPAKKTRGWGLLGSPGDLWRSGRPVVLM